MNFQEYLDDRDRVPLLEGIDINPITRTVSFTDEHEHYVDTSLNNNPTVDMRTISIFKRKPSASGDNISDGNPLVYALKDLNGWRISDMDRSKILKRVELILDKLTNSFDIIILAPSTNSLVEVFGGVIKKRFPNATVLNRCLVKRTKEEVYEAMSPWVEFSEDEIEEINIAFDSMEHWFEAKKLKKSILNEIDINIVKYNPLFKDGSIISNSNVLIVDDVISTGISMGSCARVISENYSPNSITNLVMFSLIQK